MLYFKSMTAISGSIDIYGLNQIIHVTVKTGGLFFFTWSIFWRFLFLKVYRANFSNGIIWCVSHVFRSKGSKFGFVDDEIVISEIVFKKNYPISVLCRCNCWLCWKFGVFMFVFICVRYMCYVKVYVMKSALWLCIVDWLSCGTAGQ